MVEPYGQPRPPMLPKGEPQWVFGSQRQRADGLSPEERAVDCSGFNAVSVKIIVYGSPGATIQIVGGSSPGDANYLAVPDPAGRMQNVNDSRVVDVIAGQRFIRVLLSSGTWTGNAGYVIEVTPYIAPGQTTLELTATASQDLEEVSGETLTLGQKTKAKSIPVTLASDQGSTGTQEISDGDDETQGAIADAAATPGSTGTISAKLRLLTTIANALKTEIALAASSGVDIGSVALLASSAIVGSVVGAPLRHALVTRTRPSNVTAYAANDVIADTESSPTLITFANAAREDGGSGYVVAARLTTNQDTFDTPVRLHLYHDAPTAIADNAAMAVLAADAGKKIGTLDFSTPASGEASASDAAEAASGLDGGLRLPFTCESDSNDLYGILETLEGFTPVSAQTFAVELVVDTN